jgi:hypothetical protein
MKYFRIAIRPILITFTEMGAIFVAANICCGAEPTPTTAAPHPIVQVADKVVLPDEVTVITLIHRGGPGFVEKNPIALIRTDKNAFYFRRLAKALIDNGFLKLKKVYFGGFDAPGIEITLKYGKQEKVVVNSDYRTESDPTYLFEMLILGADADMKGRYGPQKKLNPTH